MKYKFRRKDNLRISFLVWMILVSLLLGLLWFRYHQKPKPLKEIVYRGEVVEFRNDLRKANEIPVYPNELAIREILFNNSPRKVTILFKPVENNSIYAVEAFEITYKLLRYAYPSYGFFPKFEGLNVTSYTGLEGSRSNPLIILVHPAYSNETSVRVEGYKIIISGTTEEEFDLATVRFLMAAMGIKV